MSDTPLTDMLRALVASGEADPDRPDLTLARLKKHRESVQKGRTAPKTSQTVSGATDGAEEA